MMRNKFLDILKFIAAIFVVFIHVELPDTIGLLVSGVARFAVPVFFISSGYYSYGPIREDNYAKIKKRAVNLIKIFIISFSCYILGFIVLNHTIFNETWLVLLKDWSNYFKIIFFNYPFDSYFLHLWFILALIYVYLILIFILKFKLKKLLNFLPIIIIFTAFFFDIVLGKMQIIVTPLLGRNFLMMGLPLFSIGYSIKQYENRIKKPKQWILSSFVVGIVLFIIEFIFFSRNSEVYFGMVLVASSLFSLTVYLDKKHKEISLKYVDNLGDISLYIYVFHILVNNIILKIIKNFDLQTSTVFDYVYPFIVIIITLLISVLLKSKNLFLQKKHN